MCVCVCVCVLICEIYGYIYYQIDRNTVCVCMCAFVCEREKKKRGGYIERDEERETV